MAQAELRTTAGLEVVGVAPLFDVRGFALDVFHQLFAVTPDGERFVMLRQVSTGSRAAKPTMVMARHWVADLERTLAR
jgi:hypothetical protein